MSLRLRVEPPGTAPFAHESQAASVVVGRSTQADLVVADSYLSRRHARLYLEPDGWYVEDLGSKNPTRVNGRPVAARERLQPGDVIELASTRLVFEPAENAPPGLRIDSTVFRPASEILGLGEADLTARRATVEGLAGRLRLLNEVHRALAGPISLEELLELILERAFAVLHPEEGVILLRGPDGELRPAASRRVPGLTGEFLHSRRLAQEVTEKGLAALVSDASLDERFATAESFLSLGVRGLVAAPLLDAEGCLGMISLNSRAHLRRFSEADMELLVSLASAAALRIRNIALGEEAARRQLMERELALASEIQMGMLPRRFPERREFDLAATLKPAHSVGGDLYDVLLEGERLWLIVGDVSGKGVSAALFMAVARTLFRAVVPGAASLAAALGRMNRELARDNDRALFVTAFAGCLDLATGELAMANAGHNVPFLLRGDGSVGPLVAPKAMALGVEPEREYPTGSLRLAPGDRLLLYTDGVTEARDGKDQLFSEARLEATLRAAGEAGAEELVRICLAAVEAFAAGAPQSDDIALLALQYHGRG